MAESNTKCAPSKEYDGGTCMSLDMLIALAEAYNKVHDDKIQFSDKLDTLNQTKYKQYLVSQFEKRLDKVCDNQKCWVKQDFAKMLDEKMQLELKKNTWRPNSPQGKFTWLNTFDINDVAEQYESKYKDFKFLGAVPIDFEKINYGVEGMNVGFKDVDLTKLPAKKFGIIFNLDKHDEPGSHWVAGYIDVDKGDVLYFDSYGRRPEKPIANWLRKVYKSMDKSGNNKGSVRRNKVDDIVVNDVRHQYKNSECGVYSLHFIISLLEGKSFENIVNAKTPDDEMNANRKIYFSGGSIKKKK